jgi:hypothetical protein
MVGGGGVLLLGGAGSASDGVTPITATNAVAARTPRIVRFSRFEAT